MTDSISLDRIPPQASNRQTVRPKGIPGRIGMGLFMLLIVLVAVLSALPVILLFFLTAVPTVIAAVLTLIDVSIVVALFRPDRSPWLVLGGFLGWVIVAALAVVLSQQFASTPPITDANGQLIPGSIAALETVELGGSEQWITIRGHSEDLPVLLFLAGGPGGSELVMTRRYLGELEKHFIVVNWDQPGTGKSYRAADFDTVTPERYVSDAHELTLYLRERFDEDKIYVFGESWGSILGIWLVQQYPDLVHALVTTGQMVDVVENDTLMYEFAIELLSEQGRPDAIERLHRIGPPPYPRDKLLGGFGASNDILNGYMHAHAHGEGTGHNLLFDSLAAQEYGLLDKVYWLLGLRDGFLTVYPQLYDLDFRAQATQVDVPVYFIKGRWDVNAMNPLLEEYFAILKAPHKELIWFEDSAHTPSWDEPGHFIEVMVNTVLSQTESSQRAEG
ncbi:MAG: alpha/beta hydrolase [Anaerolineae bacterium]|nr:alpha/beta hydrolase [Anaerolineae bacterium]